ncbi:MAG: transcription-repair coupling factor [Bryobacterales bacterium]|nr:transcription-repair coupling factor [Bryobacterales bacterium]
MSQDLLSNLLLSLATDSRFTAALTAIEDGAAWQAAAGPLRITGLNPSSKALYVLLLAWRLRRPITVVTASVKEAEALHQAALALYPLLPEALAGSPVLLPALDVLPFQRLSPHAEILQQRALALGLMAQAATAVAVMPATSALLRTEERAFHQRMSLELRRGEEVLLEDVVAYLDSVGYLRTEPVTMLGEYSVRGGILDVFAAGSDDPVRIEFFGDEIESMRRFHADTQRSVASLESCSVPPLVEYPKSHELFVDLREALGDDVVPSTAPFSGWQQAVPAVRPRKATALDLIPGAILLLDEPAQCDAAVEKFWQRLGDAGAQCFFPPETAYLPEAEWQRVFSKAAHITMEELDLLTTGVARGVHLHIATRPGFRFHGNMKQAVEEALHLRDQDTATVFFASNAGELERLADVFEEYECPFQIVLHAHHPAWEAIRKRDYRTVSSARVLLSQSTFRTGFLLPEAQVCFVGAEDLFDSSALVAERSSRPGQHLASFTLDISDLKTGDLVVHREHGVGRFLGLKEVVQDGVKTDFMLLEYANDSKLYVPLTRMDLVQKFRGGGEAKPQIDRLGGITWQRTKARVKARMRDMADELLKLYAQRKLARGFAFSADSNWQREFEDSFAFTETVDQDRAITEIKRDMESELPMDRLLCGDVGYGKTEVAMRAAFKALGDGKQVAVLAPTTVLSFQHFETFKRRFAAFPVRIDLVSRFRSAKEIKQSLEDLANGRTDIIIGTHRLLSADVKFHDLGMLIIDEEQRFGVRHKERLKQLRQNVDSLAMSATPIPRTLHMSLLGLRDLSVIETPPKDRLAIHTVVAHFDDELIQMALEQELTRGGQVYFVHNRVESIFARAGHIQKLAPQARIGVGHGQMPDAELERVMLGFMGREFDVLVSTSIVENGLDIPLANTMLIEHADRFGLSELYQLRGRVGRSNRRAYAYLLVPPDGTLSDIARKRLAALKEFSDLGAGFKIAALDLELRGAGNLLGGEQHGHIDAVGYDTFMSMLEETIREMRGEEVPPEVYSSINLGLDVRIPSDYIPDETQRLRAYKQIADIANPTDAKRVLDDLRDRYGAPPEALTFLTEFSLCKTLARELGVESLDKRGQAMLVKFHPKTRINPERLMRLVQKEEGAQFTPAGVLRLPLKPIDGTGHLLAQVKSFLLQLQ